MSEAIKYDKDKVRMDLIPPELLEAVGIVLTYGAKKYSQGRDWERGGFRWGRLTAALLRHLTAWMKGEDIDKESGLHHLNHAACNIAFLIAHVRRGIGVDDRFCVPEETSEENNN